VALNGDAVRAGAFADLGVLVPVLAAYETLHGAGIIHGDGGTVVTAVVAVFVAPLLGGIVAARRDPATPLTASAVASLVAVAVFVVVRVVDAVVRDRPTTVAGTAIVVMLSVAVGVVGAVVDGRWSSRGRPPGGPPAMSSQP
jgi:hypothetical protein